MGQIASMVEGLIRQGAKGREIIAAIAKAEEEQAQPQKSQQFKAEFEAAWKQFPHKVAKPAALKAYVAAIRRGEKPASIFEGMVRYINTKPIDRPWLMFSTFCNQERWNDVPAIVEFRPERRHTPADAARELLAEMEGLQNGRHHTENLGTGAVALGFSTAKPS